MKKNILIISGGMSAEHEVSLNSGNEVFKNINKSKYNVKLLILPKTKPNWSHILPKFKNVDCVFIALHGKFGEDGAIQGFLESIGILYTGSGILASALGMDKLRFKYILESNNFLTPKHVSIKKADSHDNIKNKLGMPPYFVKPFDEGSSVGCSIVTKVNQLGKALKLSFEYSNIVLIENYIKGTEVTCAVMGNENPRVLPVIEIKPKKEIFFDYSSKYEEGGANEIVPAKIPDKFTKQIQKQSIEIYELVGCRGFARVDFIISRNKLYCLEINTIPGLTAASLFPKAAAAAGLSYSNLVDKIIEYGLEKK